MSTRPLINLHSSGPAVEELQQLLVARGALPFNQPGLFDYQTEGAVKILQHLAGLVVDGWVGPATWGELDREAPGGCAADTRARLPRYRFPTSHPLGSRYGPRGAIAGTAHTKRHMHHGVDQLTPRGTPMPAIGRGRVDAVVFGDPSAGNYLRLEHERGIYSTMLHADQLTADHGDLVDDTTPVATAGASGDVTGAHLHLGLFLLVGRVFVPVDPTAIVAERS